MAKKNAKALATTSQPEFDINARARSVYGDQVRWEFIHVVEAWYGASTLGERRDHVVDEINVVLAHEAGGCVAEAIIAFHALQCNALPAPRIEIFHDAWAVIFGLAPELLPALATLAGRPRTNPYDYDAISDVTPRQICDRLLALGFADTTPRTNPYD